MKAQHAISKNNEEDFSDALTILLDEITVRQIAIIWLVKLITLKGEEIKFRWFKFLHVLMLKILVTHLLTELGRDMFFDS